MFGLIVRNIVNRVDEDKGNCFFKELLKGCMKCWEKWIDLCIMWCWDLRELNKGECESRR